MTRYRRLLGTAGGVAVVLASVWFFSARATAQSSAVPTLGRSLFLTGCSSCHGATGAGVVTSAGRVRGPSLVNVGEASAYYQISTGRMPLASSGVSPQRVRPVYDQTQTQALVAFVGSLGTGPALPDIDVVGADLAKGGELFRANCAACHSASGAGGALSYGRAAPDLAHSSPLQVGAAVRSGPGQMPLFDDVTIDRAELNAVARYVQYLRAPDDAGGLPIGRTGPVPEGSVALTFGIGALLGLAAWIGTRSPVGRRTGKLDS